MRISDWSSDVCSSDLPPPLYSRVAAHSAGWLTMIPLANRTAIEFAYDSRFLADADALAALATMLGRSVATAPPAPLATAARPRPWAGNVLADGPAYRKPVVYGTRVSVPSDISAG